MTVTTHIHCSSRYDRSPDSLETDLDTWMGRADLITLTEITNDRRAATLRENGWAYFNSTRDDGSDNCGICWDTSVWTKKRSHIVALQNNRYYTLTHRVAPHVYAITLLLKNKLSADLLMVSVTHFPAHVQGHGGFAPNGGQTDVEWRARKLAYTTSMTNWSNTVKRQMAAMKPDCVLAVADWNLDLKEQWVRNYIHDHWAGTGLQLVWRNLPTSGTSINNGNRVIDGSLYKGMAISGEPHIMDAVRSSDHRPYVESFKLSRGANPDPTDPPPPTNTKPGDPWWGFGDYLIDELFVPDTGVGEAQGEVL